MHPLKVVSILLLIAGAIIFAVGVFILWRCQPPYGWASIFIMFGILFLLGAIIMICIAQQYDMKSPIQQVEIQQSQQS